MENNPSQVVVAFDYSNIFFRGLFTCVSKKASNGLYFSAEEDLQMLGNVVLYQVATLVKDLAVGCQVVFCADTLSSWRKEAIKKIDRLNNLGYKEGRKKKEDFDWDAIHKTMQEVLCILRDRGYNTLAIPHAEADDIMALLSDTLLGKTTSSSLIIVSSDEDLRQLIRLKKETGQYVMVINPMSSQEKDPLRRGKRCIYISKEQMDYITNSSPMDDIMGLSSNQMGYLNNLRSSGKYNLDIISPEEVLLHKLLCGDDGDSVPALYEFFTKTNKIKRITAKPKEYIINELGLQSPRDLYEKAKELPRVIGEALKTEVLHSLNERLKHQREMVELVSDNFPKEIITLWDMTIEPSVLMDSNRAINPRYNIDITPEKLVEGTKFFIKKIGDKKMVEHRIVRELSKSVRRSAVDGKTSKEVLDELFS